MTLPYVSASCRPEIDGISQGPIRITARIDNFLNQLPAVQIVFFLPTSAAFTLLAGYCRLSVLGCGLAPGLVVIARGPRHGKGIGGFAAPSRDGTVGLKLLVML